ncbi:ARM repeat superfamily protein [Striga asiatica]|uniref:ARM repeat superfamily protein n=1 Tax=Striga asiatica TaxID=4170 RepID=A0A5A7P9G6_STRAF|nr:ARM repeat superfamily protein [Striga asiatica]
MDLYAPLFEKTRIPHPSLQKLAVISVFDKFRSAPPSDAGREAVGRCLRSASPSVVDQSARELCRLVKDAKLDVSTGLLELQSALEESSSPELSSVFVRAIGLLTRLGFQQNPSSFRFHSSEIHPFVKVLCCGTEVQGGLVKQVIMFIMKCKHLGMEAVCDFLGTFLNYSIIKVPIASYSSAFVRELVSTMAAFCCSFPQEAIPIMKMLTRCLSFFPCKNAEEVSTVSCIIESLVDAYQVVSKQLVGMGLLVDEVQSRGLALLEAVVLQNRNFRSRLGGVDKLLDAAKNILAVQKELGFDCCTELSLVTLFLFQVLTQSDIEHEQYSTLKLVLFILRWKYENDYFIGASASESIEELLFIFPVLALVSSPSTSIKQTATDLLFILEKIATNILIAPEEKQLVRGKHLLAVTPGHIVFRFLRNMWFEDQLSSHCLFYVNHFSDGDIDSDGEHSELEIWTSCVTEYCLRLFGKGKATPSTSPSKEIFPAEIPLILGAVSSVLFLHHTRNFSIDLLATCSSIEPMLGVPLLLLTLFYNHLKLLGLLPSVASHPAMIPLVFQILLPMLQMEVDQYVIYKIFLYMFYLTVDHCRTNMMLDKPRRISLVVLEPLVDREFYILQYSSLMNVIFCFDPQCHKGGCYTLGYGKLTCIGYRLWLLPNIRKIIPAILQPNGLAQYEAESDTCISIAVSVEDVCKRNPDKGVDIILSVAACIENSNPWVKSLGLRSLAHLCEADAIDFYTAWEVIATHIQDYHGNSIVAYGLSLLLKWGAMDAEAYPEGAANALNILWSIGTHQEVRQSSSWNRAREAAFVALSQYDVVHIQRSIPDFSSRNMEFLVSQSDLDSLPAFREFEVKIINHEHITRRRFVKQKRVSGSGNKIVKLLDVVPGVIFSSGSKQSIKEFPGAALFCFPTHRDVKNQGLSRDVHAKYEDAAVEIAASLQISRNTFLALLSLQSWKPFMQRWLRSRVMVLEANVHGTMLDNTSKAANEILKILTRLADAAIPRSAENIALALGAFCVVLPASAHMVKSMASKFLLDWLSQYAHEYRQWSAAISLGLISSCLHLTDHEQKFENINALLEVASISKSTLVKGACGIGLGFSCQGLLNRIDFGAKAQPKKETHGMHETELLRKIIRTLVAMIYQLGGSSENILKKLNDYIPLETDYLSTEFEVIIEDNDHLEEDAWAIAGPIIGLGNSLGAIYRFGAYDAVLYLKDLVFSWIPVTSTLSSKTVTSDECVQMSSIGACLALPTIVSFCLRVEMIDDTELGRLMSGLMELISGLLSVKQSDTFHQSLLVAACAGAGSLLSIVLNAGLNFLKAEDVKGLLELFRKTYLSPHVLFVHLGGMVGVINAMGAGAGTLLLSDDLGSLLPNHAPETELTSLIQEIFLIAQNPDDPQSQQHAAWAISFLRHSIFSRDRSSEVSAAHGDSGVLKSASHGFAEDSLVMKLSMWLTQMNYSELGGSINTRTVALALRCLSYAPRLPSLDWGAIVRRCMKYSGQIVETPSQDTALRKGTTIREDCFLFLLSHANQSDSLLGILDELYDLARLKTLEPNLQSLMLLHLASLMKTFSNSRLLKLFDDVADFLHWFVSSNRYDHGGRASLRVSCWKGLTTFLDEAQDYASNVENCMEILFKMLPWCESGVTVGNKDSKLEWAEAIKCLGKARQSWLSDLLLISDANFRNENQIQNTLKKVQAIASLVRMGSLPLSELAKLKAYILDMNSEVIWNILVELSVILKQKDQSVRQQWLVDTAEILCVTSFPSTALWFLGLLSGSSCKYMPMLSADKSSVLSDLPVTLSSLLVGTSWEMVAESVALYLWRSTERIYWARHVQLGNYFLGSQLIDRSENEFAVFILQVLYRTCVSLKDYLPVDKQLGLANMVVKEL